ncbi:competence protein ComK [Aquibacillus sp. 3ASR75-11]|uniref:Competence protein ComK n=1 Tax=Terrihalobacillus insolitus TaxID=2950438 RepID=A0A9X3WTM6_9BACI|nr:competence protein ComK [Terrihalobacillus insolitus]MDC3413738.1 competence protein ComK [Terrihalobacillus insolitus]MDC3425597.1 competence protein ComK [Terrihalobacillus insolitus]
MLNEAKIKYEVTPLTIAIIAEETRNGHPTARLMEDNDSFIIHQTPSKVIDLACKFFGSSLKGRQEGTKDVCGITHKAPISIDPTSGMYFFPTSSPQSPNCSWISHSHIDNIERESQNATHIYFKNGKSIIVSVSYGSILNQVQRTAQFRYLLDKRIKYLWKNQADRVAEPF